MSDETPREYQREFTVRANHRVRRRTALDVRRGIVTRFMVQLEYLVEPNTDRWMPVVRYDHDSGGSDEATHDVSEEGLHIDVYREGEKYASHELSPPLDPNEALNTAEANLRDNLKYYIRRFEQWHEINNQ